MATFASTPSNQRSLLSCVMSGSRVSLPVGILALKQGRRDVQVAGLSDPCDHGPRDGNPDSDHYQGFLARLSDGWDHVKELSRPITYRGPTPTGERLPSLPGTGWDPIPRAGCPLGSASKGDSGSGRLKCHSVAGVRLSPNDGVSARGSNRGHERPRVPLLLRGQARSCPSSP